MSELQYFSVYLALLEGIIQIMCMFADLFVFPFAPNDPYDGLGTIWIKDAKLVCDWQVKLGIR